MKEITQIGAELVGDNKSDSDVEAIALVINSLIECGLKEFQIEIGHTGLFAGLVEEAGFSDEEINIFKTLLENKNSFGVEEMISSTSINAKTKQSILELSQLVGSIDVINEAKTMISNDKILNALDRMEKVYELLTYYGYEKYVSFDLGNVGNHEYYTGIVFKGYTYGTGDAIVTGGRYDNLLKIFGKDSPSMGFAINLDQLLIAMERQNLAINIELEKTLIIYENICKREAVIMANELRMKNTAVTLIRKSSKKSVEDYKEYAKRNDINTLTYFNIDKNKDTYIID